MLRHSIFLMLKKTLFSCSVSLYISEYLLIYNTQSALKIKGWREILILSRQQNPRPESLSLPLWCVFSPVAFVKTHPQKLFGIVLKRAWQQRVHRNKGNTPASPAICNPKSSVDLFLWFRSEAHGFQLWPDNETRQDVIIWILNQISGEAACLKYCVCIEFHTTCRDKYSVTPFQYYGKNLTAVVWSFQTV